MPVVSCPARADHGDAVSILRQKSTFHVKHDGRIVDLAKQFRILIVLLKNEVCSKILNPFQLAGQIGRRLPLADGCGEIIPDALYPHKRRTRRLQHLGGVPKKLEQLANPNWSDAFEQIQNDQRFARKHSQELR